MKRNTTGSLILILEEKECEKKQNNLYYIKKRTRILNQMTFDLKGIGLSFIDETPKEIVYISFYGIKIYKKNIFLLKTMENIELFNFCLKNFQIDYCLNDSLKSIFYPKMQIIPSTEEKIMEEYSDFIKISFNRVLYYDSTNKLQYMNYDKIVLDIEEMNIKINQNILLRLIEVIKEYYALLDYNEKIMKNEENLKEKNLMINNDISIPDLLENNATSNKTLIKYLILSEIKMNLTFRIDLSIIEISFLPKFLSNIILSLGSSLIRISDSPISFNSKVFADIYMDINYIISLLIEDYKLQSTFQIYKILGSSDLIGNPINLIDKIGNGFYEFVNEPTKTFLKDPSQFGKGLTKGVEGLLNGVVGGSLDSVSKITGSLYITVHGILGKKSGLIEENEDDEPENIYLGVEKGFKSGYNEIKEGIKGLFINPIERGKKSGVIGFVKDLGTGIIGFAISPITFLLKFGSSFAVGTKNSFASLCEKMLKNKRFRFPRYIEDSKPLEKYDEELSAAKEYLIKLVKIENPFILYFSPFICNNKGYQNKAYLILTKELFLVLSDKNEILWNTKIKDIERIKLFYKDDNFKILFHIKNEKNRTLIIDKSNAFVTCYLYDLLNEGIENFI